MTTSFDQHRKTIFYAKTDVAGQERLYKTLKQTQQADLEQYLPFVQEICKGRWHTPPALVTPITSGGTFHLLYKITLAHNQEYMVRLNRLPDQHKAWEFLIDQWVYPLLAAHQLAGPEFVALDFSRTLCPTDYEILSFVPGKQLNFFEDSETQHMDPVLLQAIGQYVARVHLIKPGGFGPLSIQSIMQNRPTGLHTSWQDYIFLRLEEHLEVCKNIGAINSQEQKSIKFLFDEHQDLFKNVTPVLLHGDLGNHNFISADGKSISALIDWEDCLIGDPVFDIAYWATFFKDNMLDDFLIGYAKINPAISPVDEAGPKPWRMLGWLYYLRIALSKTVHRFHFGYTDKPGRIPPSQRIQKSLKILKEII